ncbi:MAG: M23 family metallopeptidase [Croceibacterium sp.]
MALGFADRLLTIVVTATVTSAAWIVAAGLGQAPQWNRLSAVSEGLSETGARMRLPTPATGTNLGAVTPGAATNGLIVPVAGVKPNDLVDTFTQARAGGARVHDAIDIMAPAGTPVLAAGAGTVEKLFNSREGGTTIYLRSPDRRAIYYYAHLQSYAPGLREGQIVKQGEALGLVGSTGNANPAAPHLHFAIMATTPAARWWDAATAINPYPLLTYHINAINGESK